jgi:hypothetical protein
MDNTSGRCTAKFYVGEKLRIRQTSSTMMIVPIAWSPLDSARGRRRHHHSARSSVTIVDADAATATALLTVAAAAAATPPGRYSTHESRNEPIQKGARK